MRSNTRTVSRVFGQYPSGPRNAYAHFQHVTQPKRLAYDMLIVRQPTAQKGRKQTMNTSTKRSARILGKFGFSVIATKQPGKREILDLFNKDGVVQSDVSPRELSIMSDIAELTAQSVLCRDREE